MSTTQSTAAGSAAPAGIKVVDLTQYEAGTTARFTKTVT